MNNVLNLTYERAKRGELTDIVLDVIHDEYAPVQDRMACMRIWYRALDHDRWDRDEIEAVLCPIIERRKRVAGPTTTPPTNVPVLLIPFRDKKHSN